MNYSLSFSVKNFSSTGTHMELDHKNEKILQYTFHRIKGIILRRLTGNFNEPNRLKKTPKKCPVHTSCGV